MRQILHDTRHLVRAAALFAGGVLLFLVARGFLVPTGYGSLGPFRPGALDDARARPLAFAGRAACEECHSDVVEARKGSKHATVNCEACHGALAAHSADPTSGKPQLPDARTLCLVCHSQNSARPRGFPQVDPKEHSGGSACNECHKPHHPEAA